MQQGSTEDPDAIADAVPPPYRRSLRRRGRDVERARTVAYLRANGYTIIPAEIERGEHWAEHQCQDGSCG